MLGQRFQPSSAEWYSAPFEHCVISDFFDEEFLIRQARDLSERAWWGRRKGKFYDHFQVRLVDIDCFTEQFLGPNSDSREFTKAVGQCCGRDFLPFTKIFIHAMIPGQSVGAHNDNPFHGAETSRLIFSWGSAGVKGGSLEFLDKDFQVVKRIEPSISRATYIDFSKDTLHQVSEIEVGIRYSLIFSFWLSGSQVSDSLQCRKFEASRLDLRTVDFEDIFNYVSSKLVPFGIPVARGITALLLLEEWGYGPDFVWPLVVPPPGDGSVVHCKATNIDRPNFFLRCLAESHPAVLTAPIEHVIRCAKVAYLEIDTALLFMLSMHIAKIRFEGESADSRTFISKCGDLLSSNT